MTYRDNDILFQLDGGYTLIKAAYTISSYSITAGEDPYGYIQAGTTASCYCSGTLTFRIGRKGSTEVAKWFNEQVPPITTTVNQAPSQLNFAFLGTLELTVTGGILGGGQATFIFRDIALAQGDGHLRNNWWFGGQNCEVAPNDRVIVPGVNANGAPVTFAFRLGKGVNTIVATPVSLLGTADWMKDLPDLTPLSQIMMPGSHDAGMSELSHCNPPFGAGGYTQTQSGSIGQQLLDGSRYFDIRVDYDHDKLVTYHRSNAMGCNGQDLSAVLDQAMHFLQQHVSETAILKFSHIRDYSGHNPDNIKKAINTLLDDYKPVIYTNPSEDINLAQVTLGDVRGNMILVFDYSEYIDTATGRFRYLDGHAAHPRINLVVYDVYSNTADYDTMKHNQLGKWQAYGGANDYLFLLSWTLTANIPYKDPTIDKLAAIANGNLPGVLYDQIVTARSSKPNIVYLDFINPVVTQSVILYNFPGIWL